MLQIFEYHRWCDKDREKAEKPDSQIQTPFPLTLIGTILLLLAIALFLKTDFNVEDGAPKLRAQYLQEQNQKRLHLLMYRLIM